jgi:phage protein D
MAQKAFQLAFNGTPVDQGLYGDVVSLTIEESTGMANTFQLQLSTRLADDGTWNYLEDDRFALFNKTSIKIGFTDGRGLAGALGAAVSALGGGGGDNNDPLIPVFDGFITAVNFESASEPGQSHLNVSGMDTSVLMSLEEKIATWKDMSDSDIVQQIVGAYGVEVQADSTPTVHQENDTTVVQRSSDIQFVRELARRNGLEFYFETDKDSGNVVAYFQAPQLDGTPQPDLAVQFADKSNLSSFSARVTGLRPLAVKIEQIDVKANGANTSQVSDTQLAKLGNKDANTLVGGPLGSLLTPKDAQAQMLVMGPPTSDATELQTIAQSVRDEAGWFITAEGKINTEAYQNVLRPHRVVLVKGAGLTYSGKYYVTRVVHELKGDGTFTETFEARRNARDLDGSEQFGGGGMGLPIPGV